VGNLWGSVEPHGGTGNPCLEVPTPCLKKSGDRTDRKERPPVPGAESPHGAPEGCGTAARRWPAARGGGSLKRGFEVPEWKTGELGGVGQQAAAELVGGGPRPPPTPFLLGSVERLRIPTAGAPQLRSKCGDRGGVVASAPHRRARRGKKGSQKHPPLSPPFPPPAWRCAYTPTPTRRNPTVGGAIPATAARPPERGSNLRARGVLVAGGGW